jgi:hypothetical protein
VRLVVNGKKYPLAAADWIVIPVARYANSQHNAVVSLFGPKTTAEVYDIVYHAAFENTLVGLRMLQSDMLLFDLEETWQLPTQQGRMVLGQGEQAPTHRNDIAAARLARIVEQADFQSWVFTDEGEAVVVDLSEGRVTLTGTPYYHFWTSDLDAYASQRAALIVRAQQARAQGNAERYSALVAQVEALEPGVSNVEQITRDMRAQGAFVEAQNPAVFGAARSVMQHAALFRWVKQQNPKAWAAFLAQIKGVAVEPQIKTPTRWPRS